MNTRSFIELGIFLGDRRPPLDGAEALTMNYQDQGIPVQLRSKGYLGSVDAYLGLS